MTESILNSSSENVIAVSNTVEPCEMDPKPTIDPYSPRASASQREKDFAKLLPKYDKKDYGRMYYVMKKFRNRQKILLGSEDIEDPDPYMPTYIFYCFQGDLED